jgi:hypothetical protein
VDLDIKMIPEHDALFRAIPALKDKLEVNVGSPPRGLHPGASRLAGAQPVHRPRGKIDFFHYDFYSQALSKLSGTRRITKTSGR